MRRRRFDLILLSGLTACLACAGAKAQSTTNPGAIMVRPLALSEAIRGADRLTGGPAFGPRKAQPYRLAAPDDNAATEHLDFIHIGGVALISRELDQYGRIRGVDFLTYRNPGSHWDMKLNVKHGAMLQFTRRWGGSDTKSAASAAVSADR